MQSLDFLTGREKDVAALIVEGLSIEETAERLNISTHTVIHHRTGAYRKLGVTSRRQLAVLFTKAQLGLVEITRADNPIRLRDVFGKKNNKRDYRLELQQRYSWRG